MAQRVSGFIAIAAFAVGSVAYSQTTPPAGDQSTPTAPAAPVAEAPAPAPAPSPWTKHGVDIYVLGDIYGDLNFNHPKNGFNNLYNFDDRANQAHLSFAKVSLEKASGVFGFRMDVGYGRTIDVISAADDAPKGMKYFEQVYAEFRPPKAHGLQIDLGKFVTSAGSEVIEASSNWNYSRSLLFAWAIPYYHFGARATIPVNSHFTTGIQLVNGWNSVGNNNKFETVGIIANFIGKKAVFNNTYYTGPQKEGLIEAYRQVYDSNVVFTPNGKTNIYLNFDAGCDRQHLGPLNKWTGVGLAARYQLTNRFALAPRIEWFDDIDGFSTGVAQSVKEGTITGEMKLHEGLLARLEFRHDRSDKPYFDRGAGLMVAKDQTTLALGILANFGPKK